MLVNTAQKRIDAHSLDHSSGFLLERCNEVVLMEACRKMYDTPCGSCPSSGMGFEVEVGSSIGSPRLFWLVENA